MSIFNYLQLQPLEPSDDGSVSSLDEYEHDETIDLANDIDEATLDAAWTNIVNDLDSDPNRPTFTEGAEWS